MGEIKIVIDARGIISWADEKKEQLEPKTSELISDILILLESIAESTAPRCEGTLAESHEVHISGLEGELSNVAEHFKYVIEGTPPHSIGSPVFIKCPLWDWRYIGLSPAGKGEIHPGTAPFDYMASTLEVADSQIDAFLDNFLEWLTE